MGKYNTNYTREQIDDILEKIKVCVKNNRFSISLNENRIDNINFINEYNIRSEKQKSILLQIQTDDFCYSLQNEHKRCEHETLYVFVPNVQLYNADDENVTIAIYTKFNIVETSTGDNTIVISFHQLKHPIDYLFK